MRISAFRPDRVNEKKIRERAEQICKTGEER
jgi:hypothetical protein